MWDEFTQEEKQRARSRVGDKIWRGDPAEMPEGRMLPASAYPCTDCDAVWTPDLQPFHYDHHRGYASEHALDVEPVCGRCHSRRTFDLPISTTMSPPRLPVPLPAITETAAVIDEARTKLAQMVAHRNVLIRRAYADGASLRAIGEAAGLSHQAVGLVVNEPDG